MFNSECKKAEATSTRQFNINEDQVGTMLTKDDEDDKDEYADEDDLHDHHFVSSFAAAERK